MSSRIAGAKQALPACAGRASLLDLTQTYREGAGMLTKKEWLKAEHGIGNGSGRGRISLEGHRLITEAIERGVRFKDTTIVASKPKAPKAPEKPKVTEAYSAAEVREWAAANGIEVGARGRIDSDIVRQYLDAVPKEERGSSSDPADVYRDGLPRRYPEGTTFDVFFTDHKGKQQTLRVSDRVACQGCRLSLRVCRCDKPGPVAIGYEDTSKPITVKVVHVSGSA